MNLSECAQAAVACGELSYCKFLSANDTKATGAHQSGYLIGIRAWELLFPEAEFKDPTAERKVWIDWNDGCWKRESRFKYYDSKGELRLTQMGRGFPYLEPDFVGALFVLVRHAVDSYKAYVINEEQGIDEFLDAFCMAPTEANRLISAESLGPEKRLLDAMEHFIRKHPHGFPTSAEMSAAAQEIWLKVFDHEERIVTDPDREIVDWADTEYELFRLFEKAIYGPIVRGGFPSVDDFVTVANEVLNRRKSRAGKGLEHHLARIFEHNGLHFAAQPTTEGHKKPDFIFPSQAAYADPDFPPEKLISLASKRTCKDRWRQILNEADRLRWRPKYLFTLQAGNSPAQLEEMEKEKVILVVPHQLIGTYPPDFRKNIWDLRSFISYVSQMQK